MMQVLGFTIVVAAVVATGAGIARALYWRFEQEEPSGIELLVAGAVFGTGLWIAASWALALTHTLTRTPLLILAAAFAVAAVLARPRSMARPSRSALLLLPVVAWTAFVLWRGTVVPPVNHDALSYHLPKSVLFMRAAGFPRFENFDHRFPSFPANYELLVADLLILLRSDHLTEWIGTVFYLLFLLATALMAQRWWGRGIHVIAAVIATASAPLVLLHSGADKNDLMTQFFVLTALLWGARWVVRGGVVPMAVLVVSVGLAVGTKTNAGAVAIGLLPFLAARVVREGVRLRAALATVLFSLLVFALGGGAVFILAMKSGAPMGVQVGSHTVGTTLYHYDRWSNLWSLPLRMFAAGTSMSSDERHVLFSSHFGPMATVLLLLLPLAIWRYWETARERVVLTLAALIAFLAMLPTNIHPPAMPRYALFLLPLIMVWTVAPAVRELLAKRRSLGFAVIAVLLAVFTQQAVDAAIHDASCPLRYVLQAAGTPTREAPRLHERASIVADWVAGPDEAIAFYGDTSAWIHPAFGARLTRPLIMLPEEATAASIPAEAKWVVIERRWGLDPEPPPALYESLTLDRRFRLVFENRPFNRFLFRRVE